MIMSEISKTFAPQNRAGFDITQKTNYKNDRFNSIPFRIKRS